jgi:hypothetical protein
MGDFSDLGKKPTTEGDFFEDAAFGRPREIPGGRRPFEAPSFGPFVPSKKSLWRDLFGLVEFVDNRSEYLVGDLGAFALAGHYRRALGV